MRIQGTAVYPFRTLRPPFDIVFNAPFDYGCNPERSLPKTSVQYAHISAPKESPDIVFTTFDKKFQDKNNGIPPRACRPQTKFQK